MIPMQTGLLIAARANADSGGVTSQAIMAIVGAFLVMLLFMAIYLATRYKRCPSNRILVKYGKVKGSQAAQCLHGGGSFILPLIQDYAFLSLEPMTIDIDLQGALSKNNIRVNVPSTFTVGISTLPAIMNNAAERLLGLGEHEIKSQASDIILGQLRLVLATLSIEEINRDREMFMEQVNKNVGLEVNKIGLEVINFNVRDITDESGYINAIGRRAAAEAIQTANVDVAEQEKTGAIGQADARREQDVQVANQHAQAEMGKKKAERDQRIAVAQYEAEGVAGEAASQREREIAVADQTAKAVEGKKHAEREQRVAVAKYEAEAVEGENVSRAEIADYNASLAERQADAKRRGEVAMANSSRDVLVAQKEEEIARLQQSELAQKEVDKLKVEVEAEAIAEQKRRIARGEADAILVKYEAQAAGMQKLLESKAKGYSEMLQVCGSQPDMAATLLMIEKLPQLVAEQVKAIQNLKIDKITVWDSGSNGDGEKTTTANFLRGMIGSLPAVHELAAQAGVDLPGILGRVKDTQRAEADS